MDARQREEGIVAAYLAGTKIDEIEAKFGVGRSTIYHILHRRSVLPQRARRAVAGQARDETLAGLYELIQFQDRRIAQLEDIVAKADGQSKARERKVSRR